MNRLFIMVVAVCALPSMGLAQSPSRARSSGAVATVRLGNRLDNMVSGDCGWNTPSSQFATSTPARSRWRSRLTFPASRVQDCPQSGCTRRRKPPDSGALFRPVGEPGNDEFSFWIPFPIVITEFKLPLPSTVGEVFIEERREEDEPEFVCESLEGEWDDGKCAYANSPLIVDTARDGYRLTSVDNGVRFDLNADGVPEQVAWTRRDSDDAFLALDRNGNGRIDDGSELFGNHTPARPDTPDVTTPNGFEALKFVESTAYGASSGTASSMREMPRSRGSCCGAT